MFRLWLKFVGRFRLRDTNITETISSVLIDIDLVSRTGGVRFLLHALGEGPVEVGSILAATFLYIVDLPRTRSYLRVGTDLEVRWLDSSYRKKWFAQFLGLRSHSQP